LSPRELWPAIPTWRACFCPIRAPRSWPELLKKTRFLILVLNRRMVYNMNILRPEVSSSRAGRKSSRKMRAKGEIEGRVFGPFSP